jgi:D-alanine-D-alanine ligase
MKKLRVLMLTHGPLRSKEEDGRVSFVGKERKTENDVFGALERLGHIIQVLALEDSLDPLAEQVAESPPDVVFNLLMKFNGDPAQEPNVASYLELCGVPYTGCRASGITLARDKALSKQVLDWHGIPTPPWRLFRRGAKPIGADFDFPMLVKPSDAAGSVGIVKDSRVQNEGELVKRIAILHDKHGFDVIVEPFLAGREFTVAVLGNKRLVALPVRERVFGEDAVVPFLTEKMKWDEKYQARNSVRSMDADLDDPTASRLQKLARDACRALGLTGFARVDIRMDGKGNPFVLEVNPNPELDFDEDFVHAALASGMQPDATIQKIVQLAL